MHRGSSPIFHPCILAEFIQAELYLCTEYLTLPDGQGVERATEEECRVVEDRYLDQLEEIVRYSLPKGKSVAGFFAESIQGVGGSVQYPRGYLKRAFQVGN